MKAIGYFTIALAILFTSGCATLNKSECLNADWQTIGLEDGAKGKAATYIGQHRKACAEYGVRPDLNKYKAGHKAGLAQFCTEQGGFNHGRQGNKYNGVCPAHLLDDFLAGYQRGRDLYLLRSSISQMRNQIQSNKSKLKKLKKKISVIENQLVSNTGTPTQRKTLLEDLKDLQTRYGKLESRTHQLQLEVAKKQGQYETLNAQYRY